MGCVAVWRWCWGGCGCGWDWDWDCRGGGCVVLCYVRWSVRAEASIRYQISCVNPVFCALLCRAVLRCAMRHTQERLSLAVIDDGEQLGPLSPQVREGDRGFTAAWGRLHGTKVRHSLTHPPTHTSCVIGTDGGTAALGIRTPPLLETTEADMHAHTRSYWYKPGGWGWRLVLRRMWDGTKLDVWIHLCF